MGGESARRSEMLTALEEYNALREEVLGKKRTLEANDVLHLLELTKEELVVFDSSPLKEAASLYCSRKGHRKVRIRNNGNKVSAINLFDASCLVILLSQYMTDAPTFDMKLDEALPKLFVTNAPTFDMKLVEAFPKLLILKGYKATTEEEEELKQALIDIDAEVLKIRKKIYSIFASLDEERKTIVCSARKKAEQKIEDANREAEKIKNSAIETAQRTAKDKSKVIVDDANKRAGEIIGRASREADRKLSEAKKRLADIVENGAGKAFLEEQRSIELNFSAVREALVNVNRTMKSLQDSFTEAIYRKVSTQLLELFNLMADSKTSALELARQNNDKNLADVAYNMDVFLDMIVEYMADYGIQPIASAPGDKFSGKYHEPITGDRQFNPHDALIKESKRRGFRWGEQVLQKEQVII